MFSSTNKIIDDIANYLTKEIKETRQKTLIVVANAGRGWWGRGQKIGSRETIAFQRRDSVRNYNARGDQTLWARRDRRMSAIFEERATHMHEHAWTPQNACTRDTHSRSVAGRPSVPKHAGPRVSWKDRHYPRLFSPDIRVHSCKFVSYSRYILWYSLSFFCTFFR